MTDPLCKARWLACLAALFAAGCGGSSGGSGDGGAGGSDCILTSDQSCPSGGCACCNGMVLAANGFCSVQPGQACAEDDMPDTGDQPCCNTRGGTADTGTVGTCSTHQQSDEPCTSDANCPIGSTCQSTGLGQICVAVCTTAQEGSPDSQFPCCAGLVMGTLAGQAVCGLPSGAVCDLDGECASDHCLRGATTAACQ